MYRKFEYVERIISNGYQMNEIKFELPKRSTAKSAGYDFFVPEDTVCKSKEITMVKAGVKAYFPDNETLLLFNRSSNPKKKGEIAGLFYNMLDEDVVLKAGEKMMQGVFVKYGTTADDEASGKRTGGFGSTGK